MGNKVLITGEKESFIVKILVKKVCEAGIGCGFVPWKVNDINAKWEGTTLVVLYIDEGEKPGYDVLRFLSDKMSDKGSHMIVVGSSGDIDYVRGAIRDDMISGTMTRPVDNAKFADTIKAHFSKVESGEFKKSVLVVDDDPNYLGLVREWLKDTYKITGVASGTQAIKWLGSNKADLILLDYEMPVTTGPQVFEMLRSDEDTKNIPVMFLTGKSDRESVMAVLALKPDGYFLKSIQKNELLERLGEFFMLRK